jgi:ketosteroid isomerase-like protein
MKRISVLLLMILSGACAIQAQEVRLEGCGRLPVVRARVGDRQFHFLVDTGAAVTLLNLKSFSSTESAEITMESWNGMGAASGRKVVLPDFTIGEHELKNLALVAVDLTPIERSCQQRIDGVLGADLIAKLGLTLDLKNHIGILDAEARTPESRLSQLNTQQSACEDAFNRSDEKALEACLDPKIVLLTSHGDFHGRKAVMKHFKEAYFGQNPPAMVSLTPRSQQVIGTVVLMEYEMTMTMRGQLMKSRGTAVFQKSGERWLMSNMNFANAEQGK